MATLVKLSTVGWLYPEHAASYERARIEVRLNHGWDLRPTDGASAVRTVAQQIALFLRHYTPFYNKNSERRFYKGKTWYRKTNSPAVAVPGTSNHGRGDTVDFSNLGGFNGARYAQWSPIAEFHGWNNREGAAINEAWHWTHVTGDDRSAQKAGWYHVDRATGTRTFKGTGALASRRADGYNVYITGVIRWGAGQWGVTKKGNLYRMSHLDPGKAPSFKARWYTVAAEKLNGRDAPSTTAKIKATRKRGYRVYVTKKKGEWVGTRYGTWYHLSGLK